MENNIYNAPEAELVDQSNSTDEVIEFYVIPQTKLWIFSIFSLGIFLLPWNYMQWRRVKQTQNSSIWPVPRAIFSIFFVNSLFNMFDSSRKQSDREYSWSPGTNAGMYILFVVLSNVIDFFEAEFSGPSEWIYWLIVLGTLFVPIWAVSNAQRVANLAVGDPTGASNSQWTIANYVWCLVLALFWALAIYGLFYDEY